MEFIVVSGAPCSGKSTYIEQHKHEADAVFKRDGYSNDPNDVRIQRKQFIASNRDKPGRAYIEACRISENLIEALKDTDWHLHAVPSDLDDCLSHLEESNRPDKERWRSIIESYFDESSSQTGAFFMPKTGDTSSACTGHNQTLHRVGRRPLMAEENTSQDAAQQTDEEQTKSGRTDWKAEARKWEQRAKENKDAADELAALKKQQAEKDEAEKSDLQKALETAQKANDELAAMKAAKERADLIKATAKSSGVDEELLSMMSGDSKDEIEANAKTLKAKIDALPKYPNVKDGGGQNVNNRPSKKDIMSIKNPTEQLRVAAQNLDAFD